MRYVMTSFIVLLFVSRICNAEVSSIELPHNQEAFFKKHRHSTDLILELSDVDTISPDIGQLKDLHSLALVRTGDPGSRSNITIPLELLNLPNFRTFKVYGLLSLHLPAGINANQVHSHIEQVIATYWGKDSIPFLTNLPRLRSLILQRGREEKLPTGFDRLHNLRELRIEGNSEPLSLDENLCGFTRLERLELSTPLRSPLPFCLERLTRLKSVTMAVCRQEALPDKMKIYFPVALVSLPNLEELNLWDAGRIEMPKARYGLKKLRKLSIAGYPDRDLYVLCPAETEQASGVNLNAVVGYSKLQKIILRATGLDYKIPELTYSEAERDGDMSDHDAPILGIRSFLAFVDAAWKKGKLHSLNQIYMTQPQFEDEPVKLIMVWERPSSRDESGNIIPTDDEYWMLKKERGKASSANGAN